MEKTLGSIGADPRLGDRDQSTFQLHAEHKKDLFREGKDLFIEYIK
jgi:hypothetical protein